MHNLLNKEYVHIGTDVIYKELWKDIQTDQIFENVTKPYGGLWCSNKNEYLICDWLNYVEQEESEYFEYIYNKPACIIKFKNTSKLLKLENDNDLKNLIQSGLVKDLSNNPLIINKYYYNYEVNLLPNYDKISEYYDLLYINPYLDNCFKTFSINTMLSINPDSIEYFAPLNNINNKQTLKEPNKNYYKYLDYIDNLLLCVDDNDYKIYIEKLNKIKNDILKNNNNFSRNLGYNINESISDKDLLTTAVYNMYAKNYKRKVLHK